MGVLTIIIVFVFGLFCGSIGLIGLLIAAFHVGALALNKSVEGESKQKMKHMEARRGMPKPKAVPVVLPGVPVGWHSERSASGAAGLEMEAPLTPSSRRKLIFEVIEAKEIVASDVPKNGPLFPFYLISINTHCYYFFVVNK